MMDIKDRVLQIVEKGRAVEMEFMGNQTEADRSLEGSFEKWSAKDAIAHANYWQDVRTRRAASWIEGQELEPIPHYEQANAQAYAEFAKHTWEEIEAFAQQTHENLVSLVSGLSDENLTGPAEESDDRKVWEALVGSAYTHKLAHYAELYTDRGQQETTSRLWSEWADLVSPLDDGAEWQGGVHYNAACSLALAGDRSGALEELKRSFELRPSLRSWSRRDSDLESLHDLPEYKSLYAPAFWWEAIESGPLADALADQFMRLFSMLRMAIENITEAEWSQADTRYRRPAGLALHILQSIGFYGALEPGDRLDDALMQINWQERDSSRLPAREDMQRFIDKVEKRTANFLAKADLTAEEEQFPWTGPTVLGRVVYSLRHAQHHLADLIAEVHRQRPGVIDWF
jgi:hypothetical protein